MDRRTFVKSLFFGIVKTIIGLIALAFVIDFSIDVINGNYEELFFIVLILAAYIAFILGGLLLQYVKINIEYLLLRSVRLSLTLRILWGGINYLLPLITGAIIYMTWQKEPLTAIFVVIYSLLSYLQEKFSKEKTKTSNS